LIVGFIAAYIISLVRDRSNLLAREGTVLAINKQKSDQFAEGIKIHEREMSAKELELSLAYNRLQKLDEAPSKFVSVTTHQMRTPLAGIKWTLDMLLTGQLGPVTDEQKEFIKRGFDSTEKLVHIVNDLLSVDAIDADKSDYTFAEADLVELVACVTGEFVNQAKSKQIKVEFVHPPSNKLAVEIDKDKVAMILENLIDNAIKYTKAGQVWVGINDSQVKAVDAKVEVVIADQGMGIAPEDKDKVFHKFFRASNAVQTEPDGSGLGLFIAKDVVGKHGGSIWFTDRDGGGTEFHFTLPLHQKKV
ncbi:MAG: HAMP domain-containing sensor histidine kinase, partial [bacterium]